MEAINLTTVQKTFQDKIIIEEKFKAMNSTQMPPGKFYQIFKVHKDSNKKIRPKKQLLALVEVSQRE